MSFPISFAVKHSHVPFPPNILKDKIFSNNDIISVQLKNVFTVSRIE